MLETWIALNPSEELTLAEVTEMYDIEGAQMAEPLTLADALMIALECRTAPHFIP